MKVFILTEGGKKIGLGHLMRCSALYGAFKYRGIRPLFIVNADKSIKGILKKKKYAAFNWIKQENKLFDLIEGADIVVVDSYLAKEGIYKRISEATRIAVFLDDNKRIDYPKGVVVNGGIYAKSLKYPRWKGLVYLLGPEYQPLRSEFLSMPAKKIRKHVKDIMITMGGDDPHNLTAKILRLCVKNYPHLEKKIIVGSYFKNAREIRESSDRLTELFYSPGADKIKKVMLKSDIAITTGGQTLNELARVGVPAIAVVTAENQLANVLGWKKAGYVEYAGRWRDQERLLNNILNFIKLLKSRQVRAVKNYAGKRRINGRGGSKVVQFLLNHLNT